jgi:hypothetical protein
MHTCRFNMRAETTRMLSFFFFVVVFLTTRSAGRIDTHTFFVESTRIVSLLNRHALRHTNPTAVRAESTRHFLLC